MDRGWKRGRDRTGPTQCLESPALDPTKPTFLPLGFWELETEGNHDRDEG